MLCPPVVSVIVSPVNRLATVDEEHQPVHYTVIMKWAHDRYGIE